MSKCAKKILVVEDDNSIARILEFRLQGAGMKTVRAINGKEGLKFLSKKQFDLILLDLRMPEMDGFEFLKKLKSKKYAPPVFVISVLSSDEEVARAKKLGAQKYFVKVNFPLSVILEEIDTFLEKPTKSKSKKRSL